MKIKLIVLLSFIAQVLNVQAQQFNWATSVTGDNYEYGVKTLKDALGNTYILGYSTATPFEFDGITYPTNGDGDAFFAKLDSARQLVWMKSVGGDDSIYPDDALDMHLDPFGDLYLTIKSSGNNFTYDGQILSGINSPGQYSGEGVLLKVNANGGYLWHDSGTIFSSFQAITTDNDGNLYLTGYFTSNITLGGTITLTNPSTGTTRDMLVAKYQPDGTILWAKNAGGMPFNTFAYGYDIEINPQSNELIVLGKGDGEVFFDGVPMPTNNTSGNAIVLVSYNLDGTQNWVKQILAQQANWYTYGRSLIVSASGIIGACGYSDSGSGLLGFYTNDGAIISEHIYPSSQDLKMNSITFNEFNEAYVSGRGSSGDVLGMGSGAVPLSASTGFIVKMDVFQQVKWVTEFESTSSNNRVNYDNGKLTYAGSIDNSFTYNSGQNVITNNVGDALFGELIDYQLPNNRCNITGTIFQDLDANCTLDPNDVVQKTVIVKATDGNGLTHYSVSDVNGDYDIPVNIGSYTVEILPNPIQSSLIEQNCFTQQDIVLTVLGEDANDVNFPMEFSECPLLNVDISSDRRRRCFESNTYLSYSNLGFAQAQNVEVTVQFPEYVSFVSSDHPHTTDAQGNYVFNVGTLDPNQSGFIHIVDYTECINGITGLTQCTQAWVSPPNDCADELDPDYGNWDKSSIEIDKACINNNTAQFTITNIGDFGTADMENPHEYRIYVDNVLAITSTFQLNGGESITVNYPANGQTIRIEADQHPLHPGSSLPSQTLEACGTNEDEISLGFVNRMPMDDLDEDIEIHCLEIIDSFDPNDKLVSPTGITDNNYIQAGTTLDYMIRFQNTGTDVAYTVVVKDSLSQYFDPATIQWGVSSHPYEISMSGTETPLIEFTFNDINLPDSTSNELGSHGFVKFKATTYDDLPNGTEVNNDANIYFDFNLPILTNTAETTISDIVPMLAIENYATQEIAVYPNPTSGRLIIETNNLQQVDIYNISGILIETTSKTEIDLSQYAQGLYLIKIKTDKGIAVKKIILN